MIVTVWPFPTQKRMSVFTVHEPPMTPPDRLDRAEAMVFLKDGFTWSAFVFGPLWLLANRLWLATLGYIAIAALGYAVLAVAGVEEALFGPLLLALNVIIGFEAHWLKTVQLESGGWHTLGSVTGRSLAECERRFFEGWLPTQQVVRRVDHAAPASASPAHGSASGSAPGAVPGSPTPAPAATAKRGPFALFSRLRKS